MTTTGSFVINGTERVIVSQLHRSPGVSSSSMIKRQDAQLGQVAVLGAHHSVSWFLAGL
jgi:DNA-directed RNA polymerase beta subunit